MLNFVNCSTVIRSPTVEYLCSWEKPLVKPMAPGSLSHHINLHHFYIVLLFTLPLLFTLHLYTKNTKNIISIRSHSRKWPWRDWQPLIALVASSYRFVQVRGTCAWSPTGLIPWFSKTEGNTYATLLHHPFLFKGKTNASLRGSKKDLWHRCRGDLRTSQDIPGTHHKLLSLALHYLPFASRFPLPHFTLAVLFALSSFLPLLKSPKEWSSCH